MGFEVRAMFEQRATDGDSGHQAPGQARQCVSQTGAPVVALGLLGNYGLALGVVGWRTTGIQPRTHKNVRTSTLVPLCVGKASLGTANQG